MKHALYRWRASDMVLQELQVLWNCLFCDKESYCRWAKSCVDKASTLQWSNTINNLFIQLIFLNLLLTQRHKCAFFWPPTFLFSSADSSLLISDFEPQQAAAEGDAEDEFDPIPVTGRKNSQGESLHSPPGGTGGSRWSLGLKTQWLALYWVSLGHMLIWWISNKVVKHTRHRIRCLHYFCILKMFYNQSR